MNIPKQKNQFIIDILFAKEIIKTLEDTLMDYYPNKYLEILPLLHKSYDSLALALYRLEK